jgi:hypothetical protein
LEIDWLVVAEGLDYAAYAARDEADAIKRGYSSGSEDDRLSHLANADAWEKAADAIRENEVA